MEDRTAQRIDCFLWHVRLAPTRAAAQTLARSGHIRVSGRAIARAAARVQVGDVLTLPTRSGGARVVEVIAIPMRRVGAAAAALFVRAPDAVDADRAGT